jgi:hypothetical protein
VAASSCATVDPNRRNGHHPLLSLTCSADATRSLAAGAGHPIDLPRPPGGARGRASWQRIELWWQDEARVGQKNKLTRRWARRGIRPRAPHDQRTAWAHLFDALCPAEGKGAGLVMPF